MAASQPRRWCLTVTLDGQLTIDPSARAFLTAALNHPQPSPVALQQDGIARWDADLLLAKLHNHGEVNAAGWLSEARTAYQELLDACVNIEAQTPAAAVKTIFRGGEGPREKALRLGIDALADDELLALLLRTGTASMDVMQVAQSLLDQHDGLIGLAGMDVVNLARAHGLGQAKAAEIAAAFELARRLARSARRERPKLITPEVVAEMLASELSTLRHEEFYCLPLDPRSRLLGEPRTLSRGDIDGTEAGPRLFFRTALLAGAASAIAVHNHPSGDPSPSAADLAVTKRLVAAGQLVDCPLVDHVVIGDGGRFSSLRREHGHLFARVP